ncbi:MAG TPA: 4Fe-4S dicluster domain-containing protein [Proteobacteria bacterium]|nr:4Fe-4S dicluster domain-containing protein [Pseudomonadota bacterium]
MLHQPITKNYHDFIIERDPEKCIQCQVCVRQCSYGAHIYNEKDERLTEDESKCVGCHRCEALCPTGALTIRRNPSEFRENALWAPQFIKNIYKQADTGGVLLTGMGNPYPCPVYWDRMVLDASQVTNPSIDPLREPMELRTWLGSKPDAIEVEMKKGKPKLTTRFSPQLQINYPILFSAMSYGSINLNIHVGLARAAEELGILYNTGEGGLHQSLYKYGKNTIVQCASGRFGVDSKYLNAGVAIEIKIGQGAKPGIGGHLPGEKIGKEISITRMIPEGSDAISPAPHHDIYSIEDLRQLIYALKEATDYEKPVFVKIAAVHNSAAIASGIARAGADVIAIDGFRGGTGAAPTMIRDNVGIPIELALASVDERLRQEGIRNRVSLLAAGGIRCSADVVKAIALGADAIYIGTAALITVGCTVCQRCYTGKCPWGIATNDPYLAKRINPDIAHRRLANLVRAWGHEIREMLGGMGLNAIESLRGNREKLRGVGLNEVELNILGIKHAGA